MLEFLMRTLSPFFLLAVGALTLSACSGYFNFPPQLADYQTYKCSGASPDTNYAVCRHQPHSASDYRPGHDGPGHGS
jgi:hypothetical protein